MKRSLKYRIAIFLPNGPETFRDALLPASLSAPPRKTGLFGRASPVRGCSLRLSRAALPLIPLVAEVGVGGGPFCPGSLLEVTDGDDVGFVGFAMPFASGCGGRLGLTWLSSGLAATAEAMLRPGDD